MRPLAPTGRSWLLAAGALAACCRGGGPAEGPAVEPARDEAPTERAPAAASAPTPETAPVAASPADAAPAAASPADAAPPPPDAGGSRYRALVFDATVVPRAELPGSRDGGATAWTVGLDPRFLIVLRIDAVVEGEAPFAAGTVQGFVIHSPARTFLFGTPGPGVRLRYRASLTAGESPPHFVSLLPDYLHEE